MHRLGMLLVGNEGGTEIGKEEGGGMRERRSESKDKERSVLTPHVRPHLIGQFVVSLQEEDGRSDRPARG